MVQTVSGLSTSLGPVNETSLTYALSRVRQHRRNHTSLIAGERRFTWEETASRVARLAGLLRAQGLQSGDRVGLLSHNSPAYVEFYLGVPWAGGIFVPLNIRLTTVELIKIVKDAEIDILIVDDAHLETGCQIRSTGACRTLILTGEKRGIADVASYEDLMPEAAPVPDAGRGGGDIAALFYTSGSTGAPKGVMLTHANFIMAALLFIGPAQLSETSIALLSSPLFHVGASALCIPSILLGSTLVTIPRFVAGDVASAINRHRVTVMTAVPTTLRLLLDSIDDSELDLSSLETVIYGGAPMPEAIQRDIQQRFGRTQLVQGYGSTELTASVAMLPDRYVSPEGRRLGKAKSVGRALLCSEVAIYYEGAYGAPANAIGEVVARSPSIMKGYWNRPDLTAETIRNGWLHTGDLGYLDEDGFLYLVGRSKDMIITGGENVYPSEVEDVILELPAVSQCAVIGLSHPVWGETVHAIVVAAPEERISETSIIEHCHTRLAGYKCPRDVTFATEPLPVNGANKIDRIKIKADLPAVTALRSMENAHA